MRRVRSGTWFARLEAGSGGAPGLRRDEVVTLADIGALNSFGYDRRSALWQAERAVRPAGELFNEAGKAGQAGGADIEWTGEAGMADQAGAEWTARAGWAGMAGGADIEWAGTAGTGTAAGRPRRGTEWAGRATRAGTDWADAEIEARHSAEGATAASPAPTLTFSSIPPTSNLTTPNP